MYTTSLRPHAAQIATWVAAAIAVAGQTLCAQRLVRDFNTSLRSYSSQPAPGVQSGGRAFFPASGRNLGEELFVSDGTTRGSRLVVEIRPGTSGAGIEWLTPKRTGVGVFFTADDGQVGTELWTSDGTANGTRRVADVHPGPASSDPSDLLVLANGTVVFAADNGVFGRELWRTDPTAGAVLVKDLLSGPSGSDPKDLVRLGQRFVFTAMAPSGLRRAVYSSDGTAAGTQAVYLPDAFSHEPSELTQFGNKVYFTGNERLTGGELYETDGTPTGTRLAFELFPGGGSGGPREVHVLPTANGDRLVMIGRDRVTERLWISDGTQSGTRFVDFTTAGVRSPRSLTVAHGAIYFAGNGVNGLEPWISDGTQGGTRPLADIEPGSAASFPGDFTAVTVGSRRMVLFAAQTRAFGRELYGYDGATVRRLSDSLPGPQPGYQGMVTALPGRLLYRGYDPTAGTELFESDGTAQGTRLLANLAAPRPGETNDSTPRKIGTLANGDHLWAASDTLSGRSLWRTDGSTQNTTRLTPSQVRVGNARGATAGTLTVFTASDPQHGFEPWVTDGTIAGTKILLDVVPGPSGSRPALFSSIVNVGSALYFTAGARLWRTDGTSAGTRRVVTSGSIPEDPSGLTSAGSRLFFTAHTPAFGRELWVSDGTSAGTVQLADLAPGPESALFQSTQLTPVGSRVFFSARTALGLEPWTSDGTAAGTRIIFDLEPAGSSVPGEFVGVGNRVYFRASRSQTGREVWSISSTGTGTPLVHEVLRGPDSSAPRELTATEHGLMFGAVTATTSSDAALFLLPDSTSTPRQLTPADRISQIWQVPDSKVVLFTRAQPASGRELWSTLGTAATVRRVVDLNPGPGWSSPFDHQALGREVLFSADDGQHGSELYAIDRSVIEANAVHHYGTACRTNSPALSAQGRPEPGNRGFGVQIGPASPRAPVAFLLGVATANLPIGGCSVLVRPTGAAVLSTTVGGSGAAQIALPIPNDPSSIGITLFGQGFTVANGALDASAGLELLIGR